MVGQERVEHSITRPPAEYHIGNIPELEKIYQARLLPQILEVFKKILCKYIGRRFLFLIFTFTFVDDLHKYIGCYDF